MVIKIVNEELIALLGEPARLDLGGQPPAVLMLVGLQGSGKTTMAAKLARAPAQAGPAAAAGGRGHLSPGGHPQLETLGKQIDMPVHSEGDRVAPPRICDNAVKRATREGYTVGAAGHGGPPADRRAMMPSWSRSASSSSRARCCWWWTAMTGQEAVAVAEEFNKRVGVTGLILTKVDGDARGGAALSVRAVTGVPIKFMGVGEKTGDLEPFYPDRLASRILGMGDVLTLIERAEATFDREAGAQDGAQDAHGQLYPRGFHRAAQGRQKDGAASATCWA